jgi:hypothetical protein
MDTYKSTAIKWPSWIQRGQKVELISDVHTTSGRISKVRAKSGERGVILSNYIDGNGCVSIRLNTRYYVLHNVSVCKLKPLMQ